MVVDNTLAKKTSPCSLGTQNDSQIPEFRLALRVELMRNLCKQHIKHTQGDQHHLWEPATFRANCKRWNRKPLAASDAEKAKTACDWPRWRECQNPIFSIPCGTY